MPVTIDPLTTFTITHPLGDSVVGVLEPWDVVCYGWPTHLCSDAGAIISDYVEQDCGYIDCGNRIYVYSDEYNAAIDLMMAHRNRDDSLFHCCRHHTLRSSGGVHVVNGTTAVHDHMRGLRGVFAARHDL